MMAPGAPGPSRRGAALSVALWSGLLVLIQAGLGYLTVRASSPWYWLAGTPIAFLLIAALGAFSVPADRRAPRLGLLIGAGGATAAALVGGFVVLRLVTTPLPLAPTRADRLGHVLLPFLLLFLLIPAFLVLNLLGIAVAALGGMIGGYVRARLTSTRPPA